MSPEVLKHEGYNSKSDVWSIGCLLYEVTRTINKTLYTSIENY
jgi:serine/threonine protein kinase